MRESTGAGRFAPSPTGELHVGNLRTAILAWLFARSTDRRFLLRIEDLDRVRAGAEQAQLRELMALGLTWDSPLTRQSDDGHRYVRALENLRHAGMLYECFCTRRDIADASSAPHAVPGIYPGTCRDLGEAERARLRLAKPPALRLRSGVDTWTIIDELNGNYAGSVDDFVVRRNDGVPSYNLAVVVDDAAAGIDQVVRGYDLLSSSPRQAYLGELLGLPTPRYVHVPLALNPDGRRLAKRDGAVTLEDLASQGLDASQVRDVILGSLGLPTASLADALVAFDPSNLPRAPWIVSPSRLSSTGMPSVTPNR
ncbi:tRNA glutamyl-Q(34) synthetase GluQRS [Arthrobacter sp. Br18]|uniref:tRNA glutamyl-Q(34) synthetase GluQRS n=1 Tax=Arthrobacter sp. Br18 TaxID=1312954 RepID=UPI00047DE918|nr:tRNA glutamyl-Q(34) synthetase GluQRS [Arthrobacter sp. Br18]